MKTDDKGPIEFLTLIAGRKQKDALLSALSDSGAKLINTMYGKGTVNASFLESTLGLVPEENKVVITCAVAHDQSQDILNMLIEKFHFNKPNTGIAFTIPICRLSF